MILQKKNFTFNTSYNNIINKLNNLKDYNILLSPKHIFGFKYAHDLTILSLALDECGNFMVTGSADHSARIHNIKNLSTICELYHKECGHTDWINKIFFSKNNNIISGGIDGKICYWNTSSKCTIDPKNLNIMNIDEYYEKEKNVKEVHFKASTNTLKCKEIIAHRCSTISDMKYDKENEICITSSYDKTLKLFDLKKFKEMQTYKGNHNTPITKFLWLGEKIISADRSGSLCLFDTITGKEISNIKKVHNGNLGDINYIFLNEEKDKNIEDYILKKEKEKKIDESNENNRKIKEKVGNIKTGTVNLKYVFENNENFLNNNFDEKIPLVITSGQTDGTLATIDLRIFNKVVSKKKIHDASINSILTYSMNNKTYIITCSADGFCYQFEISNISSSNNTFLKKINIGQPILTARYIGNHLVLVGTCYGNIFLLNFSSSDTNDKLLNEFIQKNKIDNLNQLNLKSNSCHNTRDLSSLKFFSDWNSFNNDIHWSISASSKGGINCIECIFIYNTEKLSDKEYEIHSIITGSDDGSPSLINFPNFYI